MISFSGAMISESFDTPGGFMISFSLFNVPKIAESFLYKKRNIVVPSIV